MSRRQYALTTPLPRIADSKRRSLIRLFAVFMLFGGALAGLAQPAAARGEPERIDGNTYNGLAFGWSLSWDEDVWTNPHEEHPDGTEYIALSLIANHPAASVRIVATNAYNGDVDDCVENWGGALESSGLLEDIERTELDEGINLPGDAAEGAYTYNVPVTDDPLIFVEYVQCRPLSEGVNLVLTVAAIPEDYEDALPLFSDLVDEISIDGDRPSAPEASNPSRFDGNTYNGLDYGWSVSWDETAWTAPYDTHSDGYEYVALNAADDSLGATARLLATNAYGGDVDNCVEQWGDALEAGGLFEDVERTELDQGIDLPPDAAEGAYTYHTTISDDPFIWVEYVQCRPLSDGVNLLVALSTASTDYEKALPLFADLVDAISIDGTQPSAPETSNPARIDGTTYNGLEYGWSLSWEDADWTDPYEEHRDGTEYVVLSTPDEPYASGRVDATDMFGGDVDACVDGWDDILRNSGTMRHVKETEVEAGIELTEGAAEGAYSLDLKIDDRLVDFVVYVQCRPLGDDANLVLTLGAMPDYYEDALPLFADLVDGLAFNNAGAPSPGEQTGDAETGDRPTNNESSRDDGDSETSTPIDEADSGIDGNSYAGVNFDWSVTWDGQLWSPIEGWEDNRSGVDSFAIATNQPDAPVASVMFESTAEYDGDVDACAEGGWDWVDDDGDWSTDIAIADVELPPVPADGAVMAFSYIYSDDDGSMTLIAIQECLPLDNMGATLVVHAVIPAFAYDEALQYFVDLTDAIEIDVS
jgi:hypothetical protein